MATIDTVIAYTESALNEAYAVKGTPNPTAQLAALKTQNAALTAANASLTSKVAAMQKAIDDAQLNLGPF